MFTLTTKGIITRKKGKTLTIIMKGGCKVTTKLCEAQLEVGDKCHIAFNDAEGTITEVLPYGAHSFTSKFIKNGVIKPTKEEIENWQNNPLVEKEE